MLLILTDLLLKMLRISWITLQYLLHLLHISPQAPHRITHKLPRLQRPQPSALTLSNSLPHLPLRIGTHLLNHIIGGARHQQLCCRCRREGIGVGGRMLSDAGG